MLDIFIIEKIKEEERKKREIDQPFLEIPTPELIPPEYEEEEKKKKKEENDGIIIIE